MTISEEKAKKMSKPYKPDEAECFICNKSIKSDEEWAGVEKGLLHMGCMKKQMVESVVKSVQPPKPSECDCPKPPNVVYRDCPIHGRPLKQEWEERLELLFCRPWGTKEIKAFIKDLLKEREREIVEKVEKLKMKCFCNGHVERNMVLDDILSELKGDK